MHLLFAFVVRFVLFKNTKKWGITMDNAEIKTVLQDIVYYAYHDKISEKEYEKLTKFYVRCENRIVRSYHGKYNCSTHTITIVNLYREPAQIICTTIHELAHHVDYMLRGTTNHRKEFYLVFSRLLYAGLDMGLFAKEEVLDMQRDASDSRKIKNIVESYVSSPIPYKNDKKKVIVKNGYAIKKP